MPPCAALEGGSSRRTGQRPGINMRRSRRCRTGAEARAAARAMGRGAEARGEAEGTMDLEDLLGALPEALFEALFEAQARGGFAILW